MSNCFNSAKNTGIRKEGNQIEEVAFKEVLMLMNDTATIEGNIYKILGDHGKFILFSKPINVVN